MTVKELIETLKLENPDAVVMAQGEGDPRRVEYNVAVACDDSEVFLYVSSS